MSGYWQERQRVLLVTTECEPFWGETLAAQYIAQLPQRLSNEYEVRILMPKYGLIDDRRWRLHEVKRLSGITIRVGNMDYSLNVKVASIPGTRTQVYFLDNHEFWARKGIFLDESQQPYSDNDERIIFFSKGVIAMIKTLKWAPHIIHCNGWMTGLLALYLKYYLQNDPFFGGAKLLFTQYEQQIPSLRFSPTLPDKARIDGHIPEVFHRLAGDSYESLLEEMKSIIEVHKGEPTPEVWTDFYQQLLTQAAI
ncbi:MAG: glycogen/starch synthase [Bacteroidia bacterium]|nr:glycogen/starch synthase [Bacteroidia bacterium]MCX7764516.1 glycogen/starch synthase [Bacteroidia bacterium]MDW8057983.1 glycogen/starch synthase [Bacteroidia bacterium]